MSYAIREALLCVAGCAIVIALVGAIVLCMLQPFGAVL